MISIKRNILLNPGPATTTDTVKQALIVPDICPREEEFSALIREIKDSLVKIAGGTNDHTAVLFSGSGTAVMDAVINSVVPPGKKLAIVVNGAYGQRMVTIARTYGILCIEISFDWGTRINIDAVRKKIEDDREIACLALVHHETTTGILNPLQEVGKICSDRGCVFIVDAISSFGGLPFSIRESKIDFLLSTSNKCLQGMAGLSFVICKKTELERIKDYPKRSFYLDIYSQYTCFEKTGQFQFTPPVQVVYALRQAIVEYIREGAAARHNRYAENYRMLKEGLQSLGFRFLLADQDESGILITVLEPDETRYDFNRMHDALYHHGFTIYPGKIHDQRSFRLSILGAVYPEDIRAFVVALEEFINAEGISIIYRSRE